MERARERGLRTDLGASWERGLCGAQGGLLSYPCLNMQCEHTCGSLLTVA